MVSSLESDTGHQAGHEKMGQRLILQLPLAGRRKYIEGKNRFNHGVQLHVRV